MALTAALKAAEEAETTFNHTWTYHRKIAERLLAADHLWTEPAAPSFKIAPFGGEVDRDALREVWEAFIRPTQADDAPPQSVETRTLMAILRGVYGMLPPTEREPDEAPSGSVPTETEGNKE